MGAGLCEGYLPITDPFVRHHGALGSLVRLHVSNRDLIGPMVELCKTLPEVEVVLPGKEAAEKFETPPDREGDFVVVSMQGAVIAPRRRSMICRSFKVIDFDLMVGYRNRTFP